MTVEIAAPDPAAIEAVRQALAAEGVATRAPGPTVTEWLADLGRSLRDRLLDAVPSSLDPAAVETGLLIVVLLGGGVLIALLAAALLGRRGAAPRRVVETGEELAPGAPVAAPLDVAAWRTRLAACLDAGDRAGALEALWSWLLATLSGGHADLRPLAGRRLVREAGRADLLPLLHGLEEASYGAAPPATGRIRELARQAEGALGQ
ncbi:MAG TPA: hypothetical protein VMV46_03185 [Thermoanaerobaculia bacterium]|nr:hypothetical protein [Thermoanaerobaculia bacterium]